MAKRLVDQYQMGEVVEMMLRDEVWQTAVVICHQHPGIWLRTVAGQQWFVTNTRRIRPIAGQQKSD